MPPSSTGNPTYIVPALSRVLDVEVVRPRGRSWFYRVFVLPFTDVDERVHRQKQKRKRPRL